MHDKEKKPTQLKINGYILHVKVRLWEVSNYRWQLEMQYSSMVVLDLGIMPLGALGEQSTFCLTPLKDAAFNPSCSGPDLLANVEGEEARLWPSFPFSFPFGETSATTAS